MLELKIGICDNEQGICNLLKEKIVRYSIKNNIECEIKIFENGDKLLSEMPMQMDLLFLDIEMPGRSGLETAKEIRRQDASVLIIFLTAYQEFVFESFKVNAFRYLLKPLRDRDFREVMDAVCREFCDVHDSLCFQFQGETYTLRFDDMIYIEVMNRKIWIYCTQKTYRWVGSLEELTEKLGDKGFFRIHRSYLINMDKIKHYNNQMVHLENDYELPISRYKLNAFKEAYISYWSKIL